MNSITQDLVFRQSVIKYSLKYGVTRASIQYRVNKRTIYRWLEKYDGTIDSLRNKSRRPHYHPKQHTKEEIEMIKRYKGHNKDDGLVVLWVKLKRVGYSRSITSLYRIMCKLNMYKRAPNKRKEYVSKPYEEMKYPGERIQIDVKYVPAKSILLRKREAGESYYQYTAIDEYTRKRVLWASKEHSTYASTQFIEVIKRKFNFKIECIQTDNGFEFTNRLNRHMSWKKTLFEQKLEELGIRHKLIRPRTPRHNGKVERSHRKDHWEREYNNFPMKPLGWKSPNEKYLEFVAV